MELHARVPLFLLKYAGRMHDESHLNLIIYCGRDRTIMNAIFSQQILYVALLFTHIDQYMRLNYHIHAKTQHGISLLTYTLNTKEMDGG